MEARKAHCVVLAYPSQGHINPLLHFCKRLQQQHEGITITLVTTRFFCKDLHKLPSSVALETISDGFDNGGLQEAGNYKVYLDRFREVGKQNLCELIEKLNAKGNHVDCIIYGSFLPWALDVAKRFGCVGAIFFTQNLGVDSIYYHVYGGMLQLPMSKDAKISIPGLPSFEPCEMPSFLFEYGSGDPGALGVLLDQFSNIEKVDWILCNSFYELEVEVADCLRKIWPRLRTVGPTIPYKFLDTENGVEDEQEHGFARLKSEEFTKWLDDKPKGSVVFVAFGSLTSLNEEQMEEIAWGLRESEINYVWVVRESEEAKLPKDFEKKSDKGLVVSWCHQMKVLSHEAIGCFVTHCGWNSTLEALSLGVPMVAIPGWSDQRTNAKFIEDVWKVGVRARVDEKGVLRREELKISVLEVMKSEKESEIKNNAIKWRDLAAMAVDTGGSSHNNIEEFVDHLFLSKVKFQS